jgi:hypothetical protein
MIPPFPQNILIIFGKRINEKKSREVPNLNESNFDVSVTTNFCRMGGSMEVWGKWS